LSCFEVDDQVEFCRLHHWQIAWLFALKDSTGIDTRLPVCICDATSIAHKPAGKHILAPFVNCRHGMVGRERDQLLTATIKENISCNQEPCGPQFYQRPEGRIDVAFAVCIQDHYLPPDAKGPRLHFPGLAFGMLSVGID